MFTILADTMMNATRNKPGNEPRNDWADRFVGRRNSARTRSFRSLLGLR